MSIGTDVSYKTGSGGRVYIVFSQSAQVGKTLFGRVLAEWISLDRGFVAVDTEEQELGLSAYFPRQSRCINLNNVHALVSLFDDILADDRRDYLIELPQHHCSRFFETLALIGPLADNLTVISFFVVQEIGKSEQKFVRVIQRSCPNLNIVTVRNHWRPSAARRYHPGRLKSTPSSLEVVMPIIEEDGWRLVEDHAFRFELRNASHEPAIGDYGIAAVGDWTRWMFRQLWQCSLQIRLLDLWKVPA